MTLPVFAALKKKPATAIALLALALSACTSAERGVDPYEATNRQIHAFNVGADRVAIRPASKAYGVVPSPVRTSVSNFSNNLDQPRSIVNDVLQGSGEDAIHNTFRFLVNTTLGVGGLFDPATSFGLDDRETGFGDTLAVWGVRQGAYQVLPLLGPSTERDTAGLVVDLLLNPLDAIAPDDALDADLPTRTLDVLNDRIALGTTVDDIYYKSADGYTQLRIIYLDRRRFELGEEAPEDDVFDPYEEF